VDCYVSTGWQFLRENGRVLKVPKIGPPATCFNRKWLRRLLEDGLLTVEDFELGLWKAASTAGISPPVIEVTSLGWT
jgi:hypothetical protein